MLPRVGDDQNTIPVRKMRSMRYKWMTRLADRGMMMGLGKRVMIADRGGYSAGSIITLLVALTHMWYWQRMVTSGVPRKLIFGMHLSFVKII